MRPPKKTTTRLSSRGRLVVPKEIRDRLGWTPVIEIEFVDRGDHVLVRPVQRVPTGTAAASVRRAGRKELDLAPGPPTTDAGGTGEEVCAAVRHD
jgi:AbrB family looped-hinge helix DNA binding protein